MNRHILLLVAVICLIGGLCLMTTVAAVPPKDNFYLQVTIVTGEHSRDSNSTNRTLTVTPGELSYKETYNGARSGQRPPVSRKFKLTQQDQADLIALLRANKLLVTKTISQTHTEKEFSRYFQIAIISALDGKDNTLGINASPLAADLKSDRLYQGAASLIEQLYRIINRTDQELRPPSLID
jgi:hypothetical protein